MKISYTTTAVLVEGITGMHVVAQYGSPQHTVSRCTIQAHWSSKHNNNNYDSLKTSLYHNNIIYFVGARLTVTESKNKALQGTYIHLFPSVHLLEAVCTRESKKSMNMEQGSVACMIGPTHMTS